MLWRERSQETDRRLAVRRSRLTWRRYGAVHRRTRRKRADAGDKVFGKSGFWLGVLVGVLITYYWIYHGESTIRSVSRWFAHVAEEVRGDEDVREADRVLD